MPPPSPVRSGRVAGWRRCEGRPAAGVAREQLGRYDGVELRQAAVEAARRDAITSRSCCRRRGQTARKLLLATGVVGELPLIQGLGPLWGAASSTASTVTAGRSATSRWPCSAAARPTCAWQRCRSAGAPTWCGAPAAPTIQRRLALAAHHNWLTLAPSTLLRPVGLGRRLWWRSWGLALPGEGSRFRANTQGGERRAPWHGSAGAAHPKPWSSCWSWWGWWRRPLGSSTSPRR